jgi:molybdate transport system substrate-binding protein
MRLKRGEEIDVIIMAAPRLDELIKEGRVRADGRVDLARSNIAMAVKAGAPKPDISTLDALTKTLLAAKSIACSDSDSGVYLTTVLFQKLGIADRIKDKVTKIGHPGRRDRRVGKRRDRLPTDQ